MLLDIYDALNRNFSQALSIGYFWILIANGAGIDQENNSTNKAHIPANPANTARGNGTSMVWYALVEIRVTKAILRSRNSLFKADFIAFTGFSILIFMEKERAAYYAALFVNDVMDR